MGLWVRRLLVIMTVLAFAAGVPLALAVPPALAAAPCPHEHHQAMPGSAHHHEPAPPQQHHRHDAAGCLCCCMGSCVGTPDLARNPTVTTPVLAALVTYPEPVTSLSGRTLRPDPAPPRPSALS